MRLIRSITSGSFTINLAPNYVSAIFTGTAELLVVGFLLRYLAKKAVDGFLTRRLNKGKALLFGRWDSLAFLAAPIVLAVLAQTMSIAELGIEPLQKGEVRWGAVLSAIEEQNLIGKGVPSSETVSFDELERNEQVSVLNTAEFCGFIVAPLTRRTQRNNKLVPEYASRGKIPSKIFVFAGIYPDTSFWQFKDGNLKDGFNQLDCVDVSESSSADLNSITSKAFGDFGPRSNKNVACVNVGDKTFYRRDNPSEPVQYYNTFKKGKHLVELTTMSNIQAKYAKEVNHKGFGSGCDPAIRSMRFFKDESEYKTLISYMKTEIAAKGDFVANGVKTKIVLYYFIPIICLTILGIIVFFLNPLTKNWYRVTDRAWGMRLLINHYENLKESGDRKVTKWIGITDVDASTQNIAVVPDRESSVPRKPSTDLLI